MRRIEFKAYGGTGSLIGRSFLALLALNACNVATEQCANDVCVIYQMDYDDQPPAGANHNDASYFKKCINDYIKLNRRGLKFLAPISLELSHVKLNDVRNSAYPNETIYSLQSLFCTGHNSEEIRELLSSAFTTGTSSSELQLSNAHGCYGDLAVNGFISERLIVTNAFANMNVYQNLSANLKDAIVFYAGSTDGGTANTMIDKDIRSLLHFLNASGLDVTHTRDFRLYGLRTTPYSKFELVGSDLDVAVTESILRDKFEMSKGVLENISAQNEHVNNNSIDTYSYYQLNDGNSEYWLDGLFIAGSSALDLTAWEAHKDNQFHPTHFTELALAMQAMDAIANRLPEKRQGVPCIYGYNDGGDGQTGTPVTLSSFFNGADVNYDYDIYTACPNSGGSVSLDKYVRSILLALVTIKGEMINDFRNPNNAPQYVYDIFNHASGEETTIGPLVANELEKFLDEVKFVVMALYDAMTYSKYGSGVSPIKLMEEEIKFLYPTDTLNNQITLPAGAGLSIDQQDNGEWKVELSSAPYFSELDRMDKIGYRPAPILFPGKGRIKAEDLYLELGGVSPADSAEKIANNMIRRIFETYLGQ